MAVVNLPDSPANGTTQTVNGITYTYNSSKGYWTTASSGTATIQVTTSDSAPSSPADGDLWYDTDTGGIFVYYADGTSNQWVEVIGQQGEQGPQGTLSTSDSAPSSPSDGDLWYDTDVGGLFIYYADGSSNQWVEVVGQQGAQGPAGATGAAGSAGAAGAAGPPAGRNKIINGNFDIWQRGTSFSATGYGADRWRSYYTGGTTTAYTRQSFTLGQTDVPNNPEFYTRLVVTSDSTSDSRASFNQKIEDVRTFQGQTVTVSFWAKADATKDLTIEFLQYFGTGGSPSSYVTATPQKFSISSTWTKYTKTFSIPSITGKTLGTDNNDYIDLAFWMDAGSDYNTRVSSLGNQSGTFEFAQVQVEEGSSATDFEHKSIGQTIRECSRYFVGGTGNSLHIGAGGYATGSGQTARAYTNATFPARMRVNPTVSITVTQSSNSIASVGYVAVNPNSGLFQGTTGSSGVPGTVWWRGTVELDAEL